MPFIARDSNGNEVTVPQWLERDPALRSHIECRVCRAPYQFKDGVKLKYFAPRKSHIGECEESVYGRQYRKWVAGCKACGYIPFNPPAMRSTDQPSAIEDSEQNQRSERSTGNGDVGFGSQLKHIFVELFHQGKASSALLPIGPDRIDADKFIISFADSAKSNGSGSLLFYGRITSLAPPSGVSDRFLFLNSGGQNDFSIQLNQASLAPFMREMKKIGLSPGESGERYTPCRLDVLVYGAVTTKGKPKLILGDRAYLYFEASPGG